MKAFRKCPELICPLTKTIMIDPVSLPCGHEYSKESIAKFIEKDRICPECGMKVKINRN